MQKRPEKHAGRKMLPRCLGLCLVVLLLWQTAGGAYVLTGEHLIALIIERMGRAGTLAVAQQVTMYRPAETAPPVQAEQSLWYVFPEMYRSDIRSGDSRRVHVERNGDAVTLFNGKVAERNRTAYDAFKDPLLYRHPDLLKRNLTRLGIDIKKTSLGRFDRRLCYILGAEYPDETVPQLWLDKETFFPFRLIIKGKNLQEDMHTGFEIRFGDWRKQGTVWYPYRIHFVQNGVTVRDITVRQARPDAEVDRSLFDIARLRRESPKAVPAPPLQEEAVGDIRKQIEEFKEIYQ